MKVEIYQIFGKKKISEIKITDNFSDLKKIMLKLIY